MPERNQDVNPSRQQFYRHISAQNLTPLWESLHHLRRKRRMQTALRLTGTIRRFAHIFWPAAS